jgi:amino-acid N-acetyltransferase
MERLSARYAQHTDGVEHRPEPSRGGARATPLDRGQAHRVDVRPATPHDLSVVLAFLEANHLPTVGVSEHFQHFLVAYDGTTLVGSAGLEIHEQAGLLRSVAVTAPYRSQGLGRQLTEGILALARHNGLASVALLTTTAQHDFPRYGFVPVERSSLPDALSASEELQGACCASAVAMSVTLSPASPAILPHAEV